MRTSVLLSIRPIFTRDIFAGIKRYEYRRTIYKSRAVTKAYVYACSPEAMVVGEFTVEDVLTYEPWRLWKMTAEAAGVSKDYFDTYFVAQRLAHALAIGSTIRYVRPRTLEEMFGIKHPPQSFRYV